MPPSPSTSPSPLTRRDYGKAAFEIVGPIPLIGWSEVGPALLREIHVANSDSPITSEAKDGESDSIERAAIRRSSWTRSRAGRSDQHTRLDHELLENARQIDQTHRIRHGRPISADNLRRDLAIGTSRARALVKILRTSEQVQ